MNLECVIISLLNYITFKVCFCIKKPIICLTTSFSFSSEVFLRSDILTKNSHKGPGDLIAVTQCQMTKNVVFLLPFMSWTLLVVWVKINPFLSQDAQNNETDPIEEFNLNTEQMDTSPSLMVHSWVTKIQNFPHCNPCSAKKYLAKTRNVLWISYWKAI